MKKVYYGSVPKTATAIGVIMAGGSGTRFWPLSRKKLPKQFLPLAGGDQTLLQATAKRVEPLTGAQGVMVVTRDDQKELAFSQLPHAAVLAEPVGRNTAPCLGLAALTVLQTVGDIPMICLPSDHVIKGNKQISDVFSEAVAIAAAEPVLVTIGIQPTRPETGYGYIKQGDAHKSRKNFFRVERFVEKPDEKRANEYLKVGGYFWNSGMFVWRPSVLLSAIERCVPELFQGLQQIGKLLGTADEFSAIEPLYKRLPAVSIDVGVLEKTDNVFVTPGDSFFWSDIGSWTSWLEFFQDGMPTENVTRGESLLHNCQGCGVLSTSDRLVAGVGLRDLIIVDTPDALLVVHKDKAQEVKVVVDELERKAKNQIL